MAEISNKLGYERKIINLNNRITELEQALTEAREALKPFADLLKELDADRPNENSGILVKYPILRRAARALTPSHGEKT